MREGGLNGFSFQFHTNFLSLSNRESVIVSPVITVHTLGEEWRDQNSVSPHKMS